VLPLQRGQLLVQLRDHFAEMSFQEVLIFLAVLTDGFYLFLELRNLTGKVWHRTNASIIEFFDLRKAI